MIEQLITYLDEKLNHELPGKLAHQEAAPYRKTGFTEGELLNAKESGVLILFYIKKNEPHIVLTQRATYNGTHSGQISFPGGKREITDRDIIHTALRETNEEIGVVEADVKVIGQLSQVYIPVSNFRVSPVVGIINYSPQFVLDNYEVDELIVLKLSDLMNIKTLTPASIILPNKTTLSVPSFNFNAKIVWGATALMLNELRWLLKEFKV